MNESEKFLFDLRGYIVVRRALTDGQVKDLSDRLEANREQADKAHYGSDRTVLPGEDATAWTAPSLLEWGGTYVDLIDLPTTASYLETLLGKGYRLDHDYLNVVNEEHKRPLYLHGGGQGAGSSDRDVVGPTDGGQCYYRYNNGRFFNGLLAVAYELNDVEKDSGGFACVPGSHKMNFPLPNESRVSATQDRLPSWVDQVNAKAGDAIIFTEACAHGTIPWQGGSERRTIFFKYCPHAVAWGPCYYNADNYNGLSANQRAMLVPPSAYGPHVHTMPTWQRAQTEQAELMQLRKEVKELRAKNS